MSKTASPISQLWDFHQDYIAVPSTSKAILTLRRASLYSNKETQITFCHHVYVYFFLHVELIQPGQRAETHWTSPLHLVAGSLPALVLAPINQQTKNRNCMFKMASKHKCASCGKGEGERTNLKTCMACKLVKYCSVACQKQHRPSHKNECRARAAACRPATYMTRHCSSSLRRRRIAPSAFCRCRTQVLRTPAKKFPFCINRAAERDCATVACTLTTVSCLV